MNSTNTETEGERYISTDVITIFYPNAVHK